MKTGLRPPTLRVSLIAAMLVLVAAMPVVNTLIEISVRQPARSLVEQTQEARRLLGTVQQIIATDLAQARRENAESVLALYGTHPDVQLMAATDADGRILFSTRFADKDKAAAESIEGFESALLDQMQRTRRTLILRSPDGASMLGYAPLELAATTNQLRPLRVGALFLKLDLVRANRAAMNRVLEPSHWWGLAITALIGAVVVSLLLNRWLSEPLRHLGSQVHRMAAGETDVVSGLRGNSEIAALGHSFDDLSRQIDTSRRALHEANRDLEAQVLQRTEHLEQEVRIRRGMERALRTSEAMLQSVLRTVGEGVALWNDQGRLRYANPAIRRLCGSAGFVVDATTLDDFLGRLADLKGNPVDFGAPRADAAPRSTIVQIETERGRRWLTLQLAPVPDQDGQSGGVVCSVGDITELQDQADALSRLAHFDPLTALPNRRLLRDRMDQALAHHRRSGEKLAVCYFDLDGFKAVNDSLGHEAGDLLLCEAAGRLGRELRGNDTIARVGGDEFVVLLCNLQDTNEIEPVLDRILRNLSSPYTLSGKSVGGVSASVGVTVFPHDDSSPDTLLRNADHAMYSAKRCGKNTLKWFDPSHVQRLEARDSALREIAEAVRREQLVLHYQPRINGRNGQVFGAEALVRWPHPVLGLLPPEQFLPLIEDRDEAIELGDWVIEAALRQVATWRREGLDLVISTNVFSRQLQRGDFVHKLAAAIGRNPCDARARPVLDLEIMESTAFEGVADSSSLIADCARLGVTFSVKDFGTGHSTLDHLRRLPIAGLTIDRNLARDLATNREHRQLVEAIIGLGRAFGRQILAEGVADARQVEELLGLGCDLIQGDWVAPAMPDTEFVAWLGERRSTGRRKQPSGGGRDAKRMGV